MAAEPSVFYQTEVVFPYRYGTGAASDSLEIGIRNTSDLFYSRKQGRSHTIAPCYILRSAFRQEFRRFADFVGKDDGIEIVASRRCCDDLYTVV